jgi:hypothetical protein
MSATTLIAGLVAAMLALALSANSAFAATEIGTPGTGAGQTNDPRGVAVDETEDLLYVVDRGNNRIDVFDASSGQFLRAFGWGVLDGSSELQICTVSCSPGIAGSGPGQLDNAQGIAVDNDPTSPGFHSVYVFDVGNKRVQKFSPEGAFIWMVGGDVNLTTGGDLCTQASGDACGPGTGGNAAGRFNPQDGDIIEVGPGGTVYVGDQVTEAGVLKTRVQLYSPAGAYLGYLGGKLLEVAGGAGDTTALTVDSEGNVYVGTNADTGAVRKYDPGGNELVAFNPSFNINAIAIGPEDHIFVGEYAAFEGEINSTIFEYSSNGVLLRAIYGSLESKTYGLAFYPNPDGDIFAVELGTEAKKRILNIAFPPPGPAVYPRPSTLFAGPLGNTRATLKGKVNPEGEATTYHFEYITEDDFLAAGSTFGEGTIKTPESGPLPADFKLHAVQAEVSGLATETVYRFRLVVSSPATGPGGNPGPVVAFETRPPLEFGDIWSSGVGTATATLNVEVNPLGIPATARFEYVELSAYESSGWTTAGVAPLGEEINLGEGEEMVDVSVQVKDLKAGTAYRFRIVATDRCKPEPAPLCEFAEPEATFVTLLPLAPTTGCPNDALRAGGSGALLPDCRGYEMVSPVDKANAFIEPVLSVSGFYAGLDQAAIDGDSITYSAYRAFGEVEGAPYTSQYLARRDGGTGWTTEAISPGREGPSLMTYLSAQLDRQYRAFSGDLCSGWVVQDASPILAPDGVAGFPGLYRRDNCGGDTGSYEALTTTEPPNLPPRRFIPELQGTSADGSVAIFSVNDNLTSGLPSQPSACENEINPSNEVCETRLYEVRDGQLDFVCILPNGSPYVGSCGAGTTIKPSVGGAERTGNLLSAISADGSHIFWSTATVEEPLGTIYVRINGTETKQVSTGSARFWDAATDGSKALYSEGGQLYIRDLGTEDEIPVAGEVYGVAGASDDLSRVYFASAEVLTGGEENSEGEKAVAGQGNLYLYEPESDEITLVASLSSAEMSPLGPTIASRLPFIRLSRVTPDGGSIAFMSTSPLTGYDNKDANSKQPAHEVFLYDADANGGEGRILCPSCNPTGARPEGRQLTQKRLEGLWAAARIPVFEIQLYGSRVLTDDGNRLYFNSFDRLSPLDTNGQEDVYQWSAPGTGSCTTASPTHHATSGGCVDLISSGRSPEGSELVDISTDGRDVFFKTTESLVNQDPGLRDIYDARVEGGFPPLPPKPIIGEGEDVLLDPKPAPPASNPQSQAAGPGNPKPPKPKKCRKGTHKVKAKGGKVRCVKNRKAKKGGKAGKRANNNRRAGK